MRSWCVLTTVAIVASIAPRHAVADDVPETLIERSKGCEVTVCIPGRYEFHYIRNSNYALDTEGNEHGVVDVGTQRWRVRPRIIVGERFFIEAEADLVTGQVFGDTGRGGQDFLIEPNDRLDAFAAPSASDLRQLYVSWTSPIGLFRLGHQTSQYGYGLVANNGDDEDHSVFDSPRTGDIVERALFATKPFKWLDNAFGEAFVLAGGFDVVFRDDNADLMAGDLATQGVVSVNYRTDWLNAGVYMAFRDQQDSDSDTLTAQAYDFFVEWSKEFAPINARLTIGAEVALINASTDRVALEQAPDGVDVLALGAVFRSTLLLRDLGLEGRLEVGYASGDNDRGDDTVRSFSFDPGYQVGMILFSEVIARVSANSVDRIRDPNVSGSPPKGVELIATDGKVTNAIYLNPILRWKAGFGLGIDLGAVVAWSDADFTDPWVSAQNGGYNFNYLGQELGSGARFLGTELDTAIHYTLGVKDAVDLRIGVQAGVFLPGSAFDASDGGPSLGIVAKVRTNLEVAW